MKDFSSAVVEVTRGNETSSHVESRHLLDICIADSRGKIVKTYGNPNRQIFPRSAIKALQALALVESGAADAFDLHDEHLALACSSHNGEELHLTGVSEILSLAGLSETCLECGAQLPERLTDRNALAIAGKNPTQLHNNCSGKHAGFLALASHLKIEPKDYVKRSHKIQQLIADNLEQVTQAIHGDDNYGIDGCSIPTYQIPLEKLAVAYAKFGVGENEDNGRSKAMLRLRDACLAHPQMVAGTNRFDAELMNTLGNRAFTKYGAEGVFTIALPELGLGAAIKCLDGSKRAAEVACAATIESLLELSDSEHNNLQRLTNILLKNRNKFAVGEVKMADGF